MKKDLSLVANSATSTYINILPKLYELQSMENMSENKKLENAKTLIIKSLCKARTECDTYPRGISQDYIISVRIKLNTFRNINQVISYINNAINKGKNYTIEAPM